MNNSAETNQAIELASKTLKAHTKIAKSSTKMLIDMNRPPQHLLAEILADHASYPAVAAEKMAVYLEAIKARSNVRFH